MRQAKTAWLLGSALLLAFAATMVLATVATEPAWSRSCAGGGAPHSRCARAIVQRVPLKTAPWQVWPGEVHRVGLVNASRPLAGNRLSIGMTDTQVLSLPGWGRPDAVARSRDGTTWRELWIYSDRMTGARRSLVFENARVAITSDANMALVGPADPTLVVRPASIATVANR
jgi:hypothetical protein